MDRFVINQVDNSDKEDPIVWSLDRHFIGTVLNRFMLRIPNFILGNQSTSKVQCRFVRKRNATDADAQRAVTDRTVMDANGGFGASESLFYSIM